MIDNKYLEISDLLMESASIPIKPDPRLQKEMRNFLMTANYNFKKGKMPSLNTLPTPLKMIIEKFPPERILSFVKSDRRELDKIAKAASKITKNKSFQYAIAVGAMLKASIEKKDTKSALKDILDLIKKHKKDIIEVSIAGVLIGLLWMWVSASWLPSFAFGIILFALVCWGIKTASPPGGETEEELSSGSSSKGTSTKGSSGGNDSIL